MSWSLRITNGDISVTGDTYDTVTGPEKLVQDLKCWVLEPMGSDVMHPNYGSVLEGGVLADGSIMPSPFGGIFSAEELMRIEGEIRRIVLSYQGQQRDRISRDAGKFSGKNTLSPGEVCLGIRDISILKAQDTALCFVSILTGNGDVLSFSI